MLPSQRGTGLYLSSHDPQPRPRVSLHGLSPDLYAYSGAVFAGHPLRAAQVILLRRGVSQGAAATRLAGELKLSRPTVHQLRSELQALAAARRPTHALRDRVTETDELFQNAGEKKRAAYRSR